MSTHSKNINILIKIDKREAHSKKKNNKKYKFDLIDLLTSSFEDIKIKNVDVSISIETMELGDIEIDLTDNDGNITDRLVIIERKTLNDLISSINDGRYREQKVRLLENAHKFINTPMYIIEELVQYAGKSKVTINSNAKGSETHMSKLMAAVTNTLLRDKLQVLMTKSLIGTVDLIISMVKSYGNHLDKIMVSKDKTSDKIVSKERKEKSLTESKKKFMDADLCYKQMLMSITGVSYEKANNIMDKYGTMQKLIMVYENTEESKRPLLLSKIDINGRKLGPVLSKRIYSVLYDT